MSLENRDFTRSRPRRECKQTARPKRQWVSRPSWQVALSSCGLVLLLGLLSECSFADVSVNEILTKVSETYRGLQSYQPVADISDEVAANAPLKPRRRAALRRRPQ